MTKQKKFGKKTIEREIEKKRDGMDGKTEILPKKLFNGKLNLVLKLGRHQGVV